jgi:hypothetical protein
MVTNYRTIARAITAVEDCIYLVDGGRNHPNNIRNLRFDADSRLVHLEELPHCILYNRVNVQMANAKQV